MFFMQILASKKLAMAVSPGILIIENNGTGQMMIFFLDIGYILGLVILNIKA
jgi:hypothetical protein